MIGSLPQSAMPSTQLPTPLFFMGVKGKVEVKYISKNFGGINTHWTSMKEDMSFFHTKLSLFSTKLWSQLKIQSKHNQRGILRFKRHNNSLYTLLLCLIKPVSIYRNVLSLPGIFQCILDLFYQLENWHGEFCDSYF